MTASEVTDLRFFGAVADYAKWPDLSDVERR